jgi:GNAT superfamily N-acetyltransferase
MLLLLSFSRFGRRLVTEVEEFAWNNGCAGIEITSGDQRPDAHAFYEAIGYFQDCRSFIKERPAENLTQGSKGPKK